MQKAITNWMVRLRVLPDRFFVSKNTRACFVFAIAVAGLQMHCFAPQKARGPAAGDSNVASVGDQSKLELKLAAEKSKIRPGECSDLRLTVLNPSSHAVTWKRDWIFEQEGPTAPLPESFPRGDVQLQPGETNSVVNIRLCYSDLAPGSYRYRISSAPTAGGQVHSNWVAIEVVK